MFELNYLDNLTIYLQNFNFNLTLSQLPGRRSFETVLSTSLN